MPVRASTVGEFDALLWKVRLALAAPLAFGVKVTVKEADWPAAIVFGNVIPESTNSELLLLPEVTVTEAPAAVRLPVRDELLLTITLPKFSVPGEADRIPGAPPVPDRPMFKEGLDASERMARLPLKAPVAVGAIVTVKVTL